MLLLLLVTITSGADLISDLSEGVNQSHLLQEAAMMLIAASTLVWLAWNLHHSNKTLHSLRQELDSIKNIQQSEEIRHVKRQLSAVIAAQFNQWDLSNSEKEVGLLLMKGFSLKEIAALRGTTDKTVRQQASSIYKKANLPGRHAFAAWFIEDFL
jgi:DNA-binding CsgD family transcriptional regulator